VKKFLITICVIMSSILLYGCTISNTPVSNKTPEIPSALPSPSQMPSPTMPIVNTQSPWPTKVPPPAPTGLPPTWTPLPSYSPDQARKIVMNLYENNPCKLPCWWGIVPGETSWLKAWQFLGQFATNRSPWDTLLLESKDLPGFMWFQVGLDVPQTPELEHYKALNDLSFLIQIKTFTVQDIDVNTGNINNYTIPKILADYGQPQQIYVIGFATPVNWNSGVSIYMYYPQYGFISSHFTTVDEADFDKPTFTACFQTTSKLFLWPQEKQIDFEARLKESLVDSFTMSLFRPLDQATNYSLEKFYKTFTLAKEQPCIEFKSAVLRGSS
jgi:hypothetical protein